MDALRVGSGAFSPRSGCPVDERLDPIARPWIVVIVGQDESAGPPGGGSGTTPVKGRLSALPASDERVGLGRRGWARRFGRL